MKNGSNVRMEQYSIFGGGRRDLNTSKETDETVERLTNTKPQLADG